jgi:hypothetical protein
MFKFRYWRASPPPSRGASYRPATEPLRPGDFKLRAIYGLYISAYWAVLKRASLTHARVNKAGKISRTPKIPSPDEPLKLAAALLPCLAMIAA